MSSIPPNTGSYPAFIILPPDTEQTKELTTEELENESSDSSCSDRINNPYRQNLFQALANDPERFTNLRERNQIKYKKAKKKLKNITAYPATKYDKIFDKKVKITEKIQTIEEIEEEKTKEKENIENSPNILIFRKAEEFLPKPSFMQIVSKTESNTPLTSKDPSLKRTDPDFDREIPSNKRTNLSLPRPEIVQYGSRPGSESGKIKTKKAWKNTPPPQPISPSKMSPDTRKRLGGKLESPESSPSPKK